MIAKQNEANKKLLRYFPIIIAAILIVLYMVSTPKIAARLFAFYRNHQLDVFMEQTVSTKSINPRAYWEFREFYSPGYFHFNKYGLDQKIVDDAYSKIGVTYNQSAITPFLVYDAPYTTSIDALTESASLSGIISENAQTTFIVNNQNEKIFRQNDTLYIVFLKSITEMKTANGFFDYRELDAELVKNKKWFNITKITMN